MESMVIGRSTFESMGRRDDVVQSTIGCPADAISIDDLPVITSSTNEVDITDSSTASETSQVTLSLWYDEHVFEGVEYNPDVVQSLALADICPEDFLSADDIQLDDSGFWTSSCDITPASSSNSRAVSRGRIDDDDTSPCFSNMSDERHSNIFDDWVDSFAEECYASPNSEPEEVKRVALDCVHAKSTGATSVTSPDGISLPMYSCYPAMQDRDEPSIGDAETSGGWQYLETVPTNESSQRATSTDVQFDSDVQTLTEIDNKQDCCNTIPTNSDKKPTMAYMTMIAMAILSTPQKRFSP